MICSRITIEKWCRQMDCVGKNNNVFLGQKKSIRNGIAFFAKHKIERTLSRLCFYCPWVCVETFFSSWFYSLLFESSRQNQLNGAEMTQQQRSTDKMWSTKTCWLFLLQALKTQLSHSFFFYLFQHFFSIFRSLLIHQQV